MSSSIEDSLAQADEHNFTRPIPKSPQARMKFLLKTEKNSTKAVAQRLGISPRTVERYLKGQIKTPRPELAARLETEVRKSWQPLVRKRARDKAAKSTGLVIETRARFGFTAAPGTTDDGRMRRITQHLPPEYASRLFAAQESGAAEAELRHITAQGLQDMYFRDHGSRAPGLLVDFTDIDYVDFNF
ncbi:helix-turn-helix domain-containing protein [Streptomyces sp. G-G2]|uniref:telomere-protecting terminal protein Tpg n=1 Tax=Streptomyces sp. G-G2 TaxID=3046201 RepID=UPI0024BBD2F4|nr:helix-turn-helix domain-containing protein [Streptomyces sp. G-G2]MDJ0386419.1 helix-turn-helix domain-containing protein [Streptomyces sp. G-G2]